MVCVPCFIIPVLLYVWHRFIQPIVLRYWNPWKKIDKDGNVVETKFPFECAGGVCPYPIGAKRNDNNNTTTTSAADETSIADSAINNKKDI